PGVDPGPLDQRADAVGSQVGGVDSAQRPTPVGHGGTDGVDDESFSHAGRLRRRRYPGVPLPVLPRPPRRLAVSLSRQKGRPPRSTSWRAMTLRWISLVPSPTIISGASRKYRSTSNSV